MSALRLVRMGESTPLSTTQLCPEHSCQQVFSLPEIRCPKCGSVGMSLRKLLDERPDYSELVKAVRGLLLLASNLNSRQRRALLDAMSSSGVTL